MYVCMYVCGTHYIFICGESVVLQGYKCSATVNTTVVGSISTRCSEIFNTGDKHADSPS